MIWTCGRYLRSLCLDCSPSSRNSINFLPLKTWLWSPNLLTRLICPFVISCFWKRNRSHEDVFSVCPRNSGTLAHHSARDYKSQFQRCFQQWQKSWTRCIISEADYFQEDNNDPWQMWTYISLPTQSGNFSICPRSSIMINITYSVFEVLQYR